MFTLSESAVHHLIEVIMSDWGEDSDDSYMEDEGSDEEVDHNSDSETDLDSEFSFESTRSDYFESKDGNTMWWKTPIDEHDDLPTPPHFSLTDYSQNKNSILECWSLFVTFIDEITECTNSYITGKRVGKKRQWDFKSTDVDEMRAVFGLLYIGGALKMSQTNVDDIWRTDGLGIEIFRAMMAKNRFLFLLRHMRFDDRTTRAERQKIDKLAPIRSIFEQFNDNLLKAYICGSSVCVDERLEAFDGRCGFKQYMPKKPATYGLKVCNFQSIL